MLKTNFTNINSTTKQLKLPLEVEKLIDISDPVYTFCDVMDHIDLKSYFAEEGCKTDIRFMYLLDGIKAPSHATFGNFIRNELSGSIEQIFNDTYGHYPKYPVADAGYGSYNNYIYCEEHCMEKFMKFTMFEKKTKDKKYRDNPYRAINFSRDEEAILFVLMERNLYLNMTRKSEKTNMEEQKNFMNVRIVRDALTEVNAAKELLKIEL